MMTRCDLHEVDVDRRGCPWCQLEEAQEQVAIYKDQRQDWFDEAEKLRNEKRDQTNYDGHDDNCDCAVCDDIAFRRLLRGTPYTEPAAMELLRQKLAKFESALKKIARGTLEPGHVYEQAVMMQDIAIKVLQEEHGCTIDGAKVCFACGECDPLTSADLGKNCGGAI